MPATFTDGVTHEIVGVQYSFLSTGSSNNPTPWMNPGVDGNYQVAGNLTPDSVFASCGIQFRLVNYFEIHVDDKHAAPKISNAGVADPNFFPSGTADSVPCYDNKATAQADPRFLANVPMLMFMRRVGFADSPEGGRALVGAETACVSRGAGPTVIAHEMGHILGLGDCIGGCGAPTCNLMCSSGGGASPPTASECSGAKTAAHSISTRFFPR